MARQTYRWRGVLVIALAALGIGLLTKRPSLVMLVGVGLVFAGYPLLSPRPDPHLELDRRISDSSPRPEDDVVVTTSLTNTGDRPLFDVRLVDGVPAALTVTEGTPRLGTALRTGETTSFSYTVGAKEGQHAFESASVVLRDPSGAIEVETELASETTFTCTEGVREPMVRSRTVRPGGRFSSRQAGSGIEFHSTRPYQDGDPLRRVDWNHVARTGELTTIEFREERTITVIVVVDARPTAYRGLPNEPHAVAQSVAAARETLDVLADEQARFGVAALAPTDCWLAPGAGREHRYEAQRLLAEHAAFSTTPPKTAVELEDRLATLRSRLPDGAQILLFSPLCDEPIVDGARMLDAEGYKTSVISVDATVAGSPGQTLATVEREQRLRRLRGTGIPVTDWGADESLATAMANAGTR